MKRLATLLLLLLTGWSALAQTPDSTLYSMAQNTGELSKKKLIRYVEKQLDGEEEIAQFFYYWMALHIDYDYRLMNASSRAFSARQSIAIRERLLPDNVYKLRRSICSGYASLYQHLLGQFGIQSEIVAGYTKQPRDLRAGREVASDHAWNTVKIDENWYLVDVTWAAPIMEYEALRNFYFKTTPSHFVYDHMPENEADQFLDQPYDLEWMNRKVATTPRYFAFSEGEDRSISWHQTNGDSLVVEIAKDSDGWKLSPVAVDNQDQLLQDLNFELEQLDNGRLRYTISNFPAGAILRMDGRKGDQFSWTTWDGFIYITPESTVKLKAGPN